MHKKNIGITTTHLKAILNENYTRGVNGKDYGPLKVELENELYKRQHKIDSENEKKLMEFAEHWEGPKNLEIDSDELPY